MAFAHSSPLKKLCVSLCLLFYTAHLFFQVSSEEFHMKSMYLDSHHTIAEDPWMMEVQKEGLLYSTTVYLSSLSSMSLTVKISTIDFVSWVLCEKCDPCYPHDGLQIFHPITSSTYAQLSCLNTEYCQSIPHKCDRHGNCNAALRYTNSGTVNGTLSTEILRFVRDEDIKVEKFVFVCVHRVEGGFSQPSVGTITLTRNQHSLMSQLGVKTFSYCLPSRSTIRGWVTFRLITVVIPPGPGFITVPLVKPWTNLYYVEITAFTVLGGPTIVVHSPNDVFMVSSGTPVTFVDPQTFRALKDSIMSVVAYPIEPNHEQSKLCYNVGAADWENLQMPSIKVEFGANGELSLNYRNYFLKVSDTVGCITFSQGPKPILGSHAQAGREVIFNISEDKITFGNFIIC